MPTIKNVMNGGLADVDAAVAEKLIQSTHWVEYRSEPAAPVKKAAPRKATPSA